MRFRGLLFLICTGFLSVSIGPAQTRPTSGRYALFLADEPVSTRSFSTLSERTTHQQRILTRQANLRAELANRGIPVTGAVNTLLNAVFVQASPEREAELRSLPGVAAVVPLRRFRPRLNAAVQLVNAPAAWNALGGTQNAGAGVKIAIIDTGIDQDHPAFKNSTLAAPPGFPICTGTDCAFTNNKVIVARSYVRQLGAGTQPNPAADSRPDDYSPRDRVGHGTAVASVAAGQTNTGPAATITGMAPRAWLGNYKVFGSPGVLDFTGGDIIIQAMEDALNDGMNVAVLSLGGPALTGPLDTGAICGNSGNAPCDPEATAAENAARNGLVIVAAAGNDGGIGSTTPTASTVGSPGYAPSVIAAGAITNSHIWASSLLAPGSDVPSDLQRLNAAFGDGPPPASPLTAPLRDITLTGESGLACQALAPRSLSGTIALILRGTCNFSIKVLNAEAAGAVGAILYDNTQESLFAPGGLGGTGIPAVMVSNSDGLALKSFAASHPDHAITIDATPQELDAPAANTVAAFSSRGPSIGNASIKPDVVAVGTDMYMAAQSYDPNGALYNAAGYGVANGTSFSTPMTAGAAALVKQRNPAFTAAQVKSALVNTASQSVNDANGQARILEVGGGKVDTLAAISTNVTITPPLVSFGAIDSSNFPVSVPLTITNTGPSAVALNLTVTPRDRDPNAHVALDRSTLALAPGQSSTIDAALSGSRPAAGSYEGQISIDGGAVPLHVPYLYLVASGIADNLIPLSGDGFSGTVGQNIPEGIFSIKLIDRYGLPVAGAAVRFRASQGTGRVTNADNQTDRNGVAAAQVILGPEANQAFTVTAGGLTHQFAGSARTVPSIANLGIVNGATFDGSKPLAPGSYATIFGSSLSDSTATARGSRLPLNINLVNVSFDVPQANISVPGRLFYVSPSQINVQIPWELAGQSSALVKVRVEDTIGSLYTLQLAQYSPALFAYTDSANQLEASALDASGKLVTQSNPAARGQVVELFANGLGPVSNQPQSGDPAPMDASAQTVSTPAVTIGGQTAQVIFSGLAPGFVGLYQVNAVVPAGAGSGLQPVAISAGGITSVQSPSIYVK